MQPVGRGHLQSEVVGQCQRSAPAFDVEDQLGRERRGSVRGPTRSDPGPPRRRRTTEYYDRARGKLDPHGAHFLTAYVAGA